MNELIIYWIIWGFLLLSSCFVSIHSIVTPTPTEEEKHLRMHPQVRGIYPWQDENLSREELLELGTKYAERLRLAGQICFVLTVIVAICTFLPSQLLLVSDSSHTVIVFGFAFIIVLWILRIIEKLAWPFKMKKDQGKLQ
jgi:membrane protein insertase Oxa1/YidC/SpoIIIJ